MSPCLEADVRVKVMVRGSQVRPVQYIGHTHFFTDKEFAASVPFGKACCLL